MSYVFDRIAHVVHGEARHGSRRERLHLDAGLVRAAQRTDDANLRVRDGFNVDLHALDGDGMAHRDKLARLFRGHDARNARARENIALRRAVLADHAQRLRLHRNDRLCAGRVTAFSPTSTMRAAPVSSR